MVPPKFGSVCFRTQPGRDAGKAPLRTPDNGGIPAAPTGGSVAHLRVGAAAPGRLPTELREDFHRPSSLCTGPSGVLFPVIACFLNSGVHFTTNSASRQGGCCGGRGNPFSHKKLQICCNRRYERRNDAGLLGRIVKQLRIVQQQGMIISLLPYTCGINISVVKAPSSLLRLRYPSSRSIILSMRTSPKPCPSPLVV